MNKQQDRGVYIHVPFCVKKCAYCDFLSFPANQTIYRDYVAALIREIQSFDKKIDNISSIFIGGGTPSVLEGTFIFNIMEALYNKFLIRDDAEITIECNPGTINKNKVSIYKEAKVNRISFGLQSASDELLARIGRIHTYKDFLLSYEYAREAGFCNINIDMMSALPGQTLAMYIQDIQKIVKLSPEHIDRKSVV